MLELQELSFHHVWADDLYLVSDYTRKSVLLEKQKVTANDQTTVQSKEW